MKWDKKNIDPALVRDIAERHACDLVTASILARRAITGSKDILYYLEDDIRWLRNPFLLPDMEDAVERILQARDEGERVMVFGDRDVDGITSTTILVETLADLGIDVRWQVPMGDEAYGLSMDAVDAFAADYGSLIITVDCGISNVAEIARAAEQGLDVIVVDHHNVQEVVPAAIAIVNPKRLDVDYPFRELAGCAVTWKLTNALRFASRSELFNQDICLLDARPTNEAWIIEAVHIRNLVVTKRMEELVVPGMVSIDQTRLADFLQGHQILVWDADLQKKSLEKIFGRSVEFNLLDMAGEIAKEIPGIAGKSLLRIKSLSRIARYEEGPTTELDVFINLFISFVHKREKIHSDADTRALQLVALGTMADLMPLRDENRILVRNGLAAIEANPREGLAELLLKLGLAGRRIATGEVSWQICPALNATGRMGNAKLAIELLLSKEPLERQEKAAAVLALNEERKKIGSEAWAIVEPQARESLGRHDERLVVVQSRTIHRGVTGIMANRLTGQFKVPAVVISVTEDRSTASLRSARNYDLTGILEQCRDLLEDSGGHSFAAGFSFKTAVLDDVLARLERIAPTIELGEKDSEEEISIDAEIPPSYLSPDLFKVMDRFEPYGEGNTPLTFLSRSLKVEDILLMGKGEVRHVKMSLGTGKQRWPAVWWKAGDKVQRVFDLNDQVDIVYRLSRNWYNGAETPQLLVEDLRRS